MALWSDRSFEDWLVQYERSHQHPVNRRCHTIGIPMIVVSLLIALGAVFVPQLGWVATVLFVVGWILQFVGHHYEGQPPEFFKDWRFLFVGLRWWLAKISGRA